MVQPIPSSNLSDSKLRATNFQAAESRAGGPVRSGVGERPHSTGEADSHWRELADWSARYPEAYARGARGTRGSSISPVLFGVDSQPLVMALRG